MQNRYLLVVHHGEPMSEFSTTSNQVESKDTSNLFLPSLRASTFTVSLRVMRNRIFGATRAQNWRKEMPVEWSILT